MSAPLLDGFGREGRSFHPFFPKMCLRGYTQSLVGDGKNADGVIDILQLHGPEGGRGDG